MRTEGSNQLAESGMVLLEVLMALTVFAVVSLGLVMALDQSLDAATDRNRADEATRGLRNQMELLQGSVLIPGSRELTGNVGPVGAVYRLEVQAVPLTDQRKQPLLGLYRATVTAEWQADHRVERRAISQMVYQP